LASTREREISRITNKKKVKRLNPIEENTLSRGTGLQRFTLMGERWLPHRKGKNPNPEHGKFPQASIPVYVKGVKKKKH